MKPSPDPQPLRYAAKPSAARRWRWRIVFAALAVVIGLLAWARGPAVWDRAVLLYWQRQCLNYTAPAGQLVYDSRPANAEADRAAGGRVVGVHDDRRRQGDVTGWPRVGRVPDVVYKYSLSTPNFMLFGSDESVPFVHGLTSPGGTGRLVIVICSDKRGPGIDLINAVSVWSIGMYGWRTAEPVMTINETRRGHGGQETAIRIYAGQVDSNDPSRFTIRFRRMDDGMIEGHLTDDGKVHLRYFGSKRDGFDTPLEGQ